LGLLCLLGWQRFGARLEARTVFEVGAHVEGHNLEKW
jgi:hypothetical protein